MPKIKFTIKIEVDPEKVLEVLYGAFEGTGYWALDKKDKDGYNVGVAELAYESGAREFMAGKKTLKFYDVATEPKRLKHLTRAKIVRGLQKMASNEPSAFADLMSDNYDIYTADTLVQCALFGKVIYS